MAAVLFPSTQEFKGVRTSFNVDISHVSAYIPCIMGQTNLFVPTIRRCQSFNIIITL